MQQVKSFFFVIHWKSLVSNEVSVQKFENRKEADEYIEFLKEQRVHFLLCESVSKTGGLRSYKIHRSGDYVFHRFMNLNVGVTILLVIAAGYIIFKNLFL